MGALEEPRARAATALRSVFGGPLFWFIVSATRALTLDAIRAARRGYIACR